MARDIPIVRTDFPTARRGWDPEAVGAHLAAVDRLVGELQDEAARSAAPARAADAAGAHVREIVEAAERSADAIRAEAEQEADRIRAGAAEDAERARDAVRAVAERARELEAQLDALGAGLAESTGGVAAAERSRVSVARTAGAGGSTASAAPEPAGAEEPPAADRLSAPPAHEPAAAAPPDSAAALAAARASDDAAANGIAPPSAPGGAPGSLPEDAPRSTDEEEARFVALDLALAGRSREDVDRELARRYDVADRNLLLDDVFSTVEG